MKTPPLLDLSGLLRAWSDGSRGAFEKCTPIVYTRLQYLARNHLKPNVGKSWAGLGQDG